MTWVNAPVFSGQDRYAEDEHWNKLILFYGISTAIAVVDTALATKPAGLLLSQVATILSSTTRPVGVRCNRSGKLLIG